MAFDGIRIFIHQPDRLRLGMNGLIDLRKNARHKFIKIERLMQVTADLVEKLLSFSGVIAAFVELCILDRGCHVR